MFQSKCYLAVLFIVLSVESYTVRPWAALYTKHNKLSYSRQLLAYCGDETSFKNEAILQSVMHSDVNPTLLNEGNTTSPALPDNERLTPLSNHEQAVLDHETTLKLEIEALKTQLRSERYLLSKVKDEVSENGLDAFHIIQAKVNDFKKKSIVEQKQRVEHNKREFVEMMIPILHAFRNVSKTVPANNERGNSIHASFNSLLSNILAVFERLGYTEFSAEIGSKLDTRQHEIMHTVEVEEGGGQILATIGEPGLVCNDGSVIRKAQVVVSQLRIGTNTSNNLNSSIQSYSLDSIKLN